MVHLIVELSKYFLMILMLLYSMQCFSIVRKKDEDERKNGERKQILLMLLLNISAYTILYLQSEDIRMVYACAEAAVYILAVQAVYRIFYRKANMLLINNMCMLLSIGLIMLSRLNFDNAQKQYLIIVAGTLISLVIPVFIRKVRSLKNWTWLYAVAGIGMLLVVLVLAAISGGAKLSIEVGGVTFQLSEVVKITFVFFLASILRADTSFKNVVKASVIAGAHVLILVACKDLGSAVVFFMAYLVMIYVATKKPVYALAGAAGGCGAAVVAYFLFNHVRQRVETWRDPFGTYDQPGGGYQVVQSLFAIGAGGWFGTGLFAGSPNTIPVVQKDFIFAAICEELGGIFAICMLLVCMSCFLMIVNISMKMSNRFYKLVALGLGTQYTVQVFLTVGGSIKFIPLTGITLPLVSYGGSSVMATILVFAIIQGLYLLREDEGDHIERQKQEKQIREKRIPQYQNQQYQNPGYRVPAYRQPVSGPERGYRDVPPVYRPPRPDREKTLEEKIEEETEKSLNW